MCYHQTNTRCLPSDGREESVALIGSRSSRLGDRLVEDVVEPSQGSNRSDAGAWWCRAPAAACPRSRARRPARRESAGCRPGSGSCGGCQLVDRDLLLRSHVEDLAHRVGMIHDPQNRVDNIGHVTKTPGLVAVAEDREGLAPQRLVHQSGDHHAADRALAGTHGVAHAAAQSGTVPAIAGRGRPLRPRQLLGHAVDLASHPALA